MQRLDSLPSTMLDQRMDSVRIGAFWLGILVSACGGAAAGKAPVTAVASGAPASGASDAQPVEHPTPAQTEGIPTECAQRGDGLCVPDKEWVQRLCQNTYPSIALVMFREGTPWSRGYLTRKTEAWNASGGAAPTGTLDFDEEVVLLRKRSGGSGGMQVSGAMGGYDVLRWDGSCVTLADEEVTRSVPPKPKRAPVTWRFIDESIREKMASDEAVKEAKRRRGKECKGATMGDVTLACEKADKALSDAVIDYVRRGGELAEPEKLP
jgi:hypothetical protein